VCSSCCIMLSHVREGLPSMVSVAHKPILYRYALASAHIQLPAHTYHTLLQQQLQSHKGPILATAIHAGTLAAKHTSSTIPYCHNLQLDSVHFEHALDHTECSIHLYCGVSTSSRTGVEMEALVGVSTAALTIYDMIKALSHNVSINHIQLVTKVKTSLNTS
jgi:cyclic pyranopterin phosphate synthase